MVGVVHDEEAKQVILQTLLEALEHAEVVGRLHALVILVLHNLYKQKRKIDRLILHSCYFSQSGETAFE